METTAADIQQYLNKRPTDSDNPVTKAVKLVGGRYKLAPILDVSPASLHRWMGINALPVAYACALARLSGMEPLDLVGDDMRYYIKQIAEYK